MSSNISIIMITIIKIDIIGDDGVQFNAFILHIIILFLEFDSFILLVIVTSIIQFRLMNRSHCLFGLHNHSFNSWYFFGIFFTNHQKSHDSYRTCVFVHCIFRFSMNQTNINSCVFHRHYWIELWYRYMFVVSVLQLMLCIHHIHSRLVYMNENDDLCQCFEYSVSKKKTLFYFISETWSTNPFMTQ